MKGLKTRDAGALQQRMAWVKVALRLLVAGATLVLGLMAQVIWVKVVFEYIGTPASPTPSGVIDWLASLASVTVTLPGTSATIHPFLGLGPLLTAMMLVGILILPGLLALRAGFAIALWGLE